MSSLFVFPLYRILFLFLLLLILFVFLLNGDTMICYIYLEISTFPLPELSSGVVSERSHLWYFVTASGLFESLALSLSLEVFIDKADHLCDNDGIKLRLALALKSIWPRMYIFKGKKKKKKSEWHVLEKTSFVYLS